MRPAITVSNISKSFFLGGMRQPVTDLRETLGRFFKGKKVKESSQIFHALDNVSFKVEQGEVLGVVGTNGAGKSTLFKILSRITEPSSGRAEIYGRLGTLLEVGTGFHPDLNGRENIYLSGAVLGMRIYEINDCFDSIVDFSGVSRFIDTPVKFYSSGMYVRLAFAVAAHLRTDVLLLDEVLAVGDYEFQRKCMNRMQEIRNEGRTIVFVSHSMANIAAVCQRAILLRKGTVAKEGSAQDVIQEYLHSSVSAAAEATWPAGGQPGNHSFHVQAVRIRQKGQNGAGRAELNLISPIEVEIEYEILNESLPLLCGIRLKDINGATVLTSTNHEALTSKVDRLSQKPLVPGRYQTVCELPAFFLNDGLYSISLMFLQPFFKVELNLEDVLTFFLHDTSEVRKHYLGPWSGSVRPLLDWDTKLLSTAELKLVHTA